MNAFRQAFNCLKAIFGGFKFGKCHVNYYDLSVESTEIKDAYSVTSRSPIIA